MNEVENLRAYAKYIALIVEDQWHGDPPADVLKDARRGRRRLRDIVRRAAADRFVSAEQRAVLLSEDDKRVREILRGLLRSTRPFVEDEASRARIDAEMRTLPPPIHERMERDAGPITVGARQPRLLVVEEHAGPRHMLARILELAGCQVETAADAIAALDLLADAQFDLVWLDWKMPDRDGLSVAEELRAGAGPDAAVPIILVTATPLEARRANREGLLDCVVAKPFSSTDLLNETAYHLSRTTSG